MKSRRSALPLPRYTLRKSLKGGQWAYFFNVPTWARKRDCTVPNEALGTDYDSAVQRVEKILLPAFDSWRTGGEDAAPTVGVVPGTLDWMFHKYRQTWSQPTARRPKPLSPGQCRVHETGIKMLCEYQLQEGAGRLGARRLSQFDTAMADDLFAKLLFKDVKGEKIERRTTVNHAMKTARTAWNTVSRANPGLFPTKNPFEKMGLTSTNRETPHATFDELKAFRLKALEMGFASIATGALIGWELVQREAHIFIRFRAEHYRPPNHPDHVWVVNYKTKIESGSWEPLFNTKGKPLYPELMAELDVMKDLRPTGGLMLRRDGSGRPWATKGEMLTHFARVVKKIVRAAGLRDELTFTSFGRHGGGTEANHSGMTETQLKQKGQWSSKAAMGHYLHGDDQAKQEAQEKRLKLRAKRARLAAKK
jgi:hypothetical protein